MIPCPCTVLPALLKAFFEQVLRPHFLQFGQSQRKARYDALKGRTATVVVTMGMPGFVYRWFYLSHGVASLRRNIFSFVGIRTLETLVIGMVESGHDRRRQRWIRRIADLGRRG